MAIRCAFPVESLDVLGDIGIAGRGRYRYTMLGFPLSRSERILALAGPDFSPMGEADY